MSKWLETFIEQHGDDNDYNDSDEVLGWLSASLTEDVPGAYVLTVSHQPDADHDETVERYRVTPFGSEAMQ